MWFLLTPGLFLLVLWLIQGYGPRLQPDPAPRSQAAVETAASGRRAWVRRVSQALAAAGTVQVALLLLKAFDLDLGRPRAAGVSTLIGSVLLMLLFIWAIPGQGFGSVLRWLLLGAFGTISCSTALLRDVNIDFDRQPPQIRTVRVVNKFASTSLRGGTNYYLRLEDWTHEGRARELDLSKGQFLSYSIQQMVTFEEHQGALGFRWIGRLRSA